jgi:hypothetical protein
MGPSSLPKFNIVQQRTHKHIQGDESDLESLEGNLPNQTICYHSYKVIKEYFKLKTDAAKCRLFFSLLKSRILTTFRKILGIKTVKI